jgi:hypothetical protein
VAYFLRNDLQRVAEGQSWVKLTDLIPLPSWNETARRKFMSFLQFLSEGLGLKILIAGLLAALAGIGITVRLSGKKEYIGEILVPCTLIALSMVFFAVTYSFPSEEAGPAAIPQLWILWTVLLCSVILWQVFKGTAKSDPKSGRLGFLLLVVVIVVAYYFAMQTIGYFISSFLFLVLLMQKGGSVFGGSGLGSFFIYRVLQVVVYSATPRVL